MKHVISIILVAAIGIFVFMGLYSGDGAKAFQEYGNVNLDERVSQRYVDKNVTQDNGVVVYGESENLETGSANMVTSIVVNYRSFDTLGEVTVLFISAFGVGLLLNAKSKRSSFASDPGFILKHGARVVFGIMLIFGVYMFTHGHLTPGGGFAGGAIIAAAILLLYMADGEFRAKLSALKITEGLAGSLYIVIGLLGLAIGGYFLQNFLPTGVVGDLISAGVVPIVYILIGLKVGSELSGIVAGFATEEVEA